ncbi:MAG: sigma-70 family RNA polymerase sigma factor [Planctomycetes bacterium]|nr:sigma-70 family RNA polymerase sigma factor [Planctomycetota bacterium]
MALDQIAAWYPRLFRTALRLTRNPEDAADMTQQAFCNAIRRWDHFDGHCLPGTWLHRILVNCIRDWARRRKVRAAGPLDEGRAVAADLDLPVDRLDREEQCGHLRRSIGELPDALRESFLLTLIDGYTYEETAQILLVPVGTIATRVHQARKRIREAMGRAYPEERR